MRRPYRMATILILTPCAAFGEVGKSVRMNAASTAPVSVGAGLAPGEARGSIPDWVPAAQTASPEELAALVRQLGHPSFHVRARARARLLTLGVAAEDALRKARDSAVDMETRLQAAEIIEYFHKPDPEAFAAAQKAAQEAFARGDFHTMAGFYLDLARRGTQDRRVWLELGHALRMTGEYEKAADCYLLVRGEMLREELIEPGRTEDPALPTRQNVFILTDAVARIQRVLLGKPEKAIETCRAVLHLDSRLGLSPEALQKEYARELDAGKPPGLQDQQAWAAAAVLAQLGLAQVEAGQTDEGVVTLARFLAMYRCYNLHRIYHLKNRALDVIRREYPKLPHAPAPETMAGFILLDPQTPAITIAMQESDRFLRAYETLSNGHQQFRLLAPPGLMFDRLQCSIDNEQIEVRYGGQFGAWSEHGEGLGQFRIGLGSMHWEGDKPGRARLETVLKPEPGTTMVTIDSGSWPARRSEPAKFRLHDLEISASFLKMPGDLPELSDRSEGGIQNGVYGFDRKNIKLTTDNDDDVLPNSAGSFATGRHVFKLIENGKTLLEIPVTVTPSSRDGITFSKGCPFDRQMTELINAAHCSAARLADGSHLVAFETQGPVDFGIGLARSSDLLRFGERRPFPHSTFNIDRAPFLFRDSHGVLWLIYGSNRLSLLHDDMRASRYWVSSSRDDGRTWSLPECLPVSDVRVGRFCCEDTPFQMVELPDGEGFLAAVGSKLLRGERPDRFNVLMDVTQRSGDAPKADQVFIARDGKDGSIHALLLGVPPDPSVFHVKSLHSDKPGPTRRLALELPRSEGDVGFVSFAAHDDRLVLFYHADNAMRTCSIDLRQPDKFARDPVVLLGISDYSPRFFPELTPDNRLRLFCGASEMGRHSWLLEAALEQLFPKHP